MTASAEYYLSKICAALHLDEASNVFGSGFKMEAGEGHIGEVGGKTIIAPITFTLNTSQYADGDLLADTQVLTSCLRIPDGTAILQDAMFYDLDDQGQPFDVLLLEANQSLGTENSAPSVTDSNVQKIIGRFSVQATDWYDMGNSRIANIKNIGIAVKGIAGSGNIGVALISRGTGTYTAAGLVGKFKFLCD